MSHHACPYCWQCSCDLDPMECVEQDHKPEGGWAEVHEACWKNLEDYMRTSREEMPP